MNDRLQNNILQIVCQKELATQIIAKYFFFLVKQSGFDFIDDILSKIMNGIIIVMFLLAIEGFGQRDSTLL